ncbi:MAG: hypothetical protein LBP79_07620 [Clostridiales bacterium]|jgi:hypothetical protein|nr:hypothetical protein [Clostridiales bacterium]
MKETKRPADRLKKVLMIDKLKSASNLEELLKNDARILLENYFELTAGAVRTGLNIDEKNLINIELTAKAANIKRFGIILK